MPQCRQLSLRDSTCDYWNEDLPADQQGDLPTACDEKKGYCNAEADDDPTWCSEFFSLEEMCPKCECYMDLCECDDFEVCDECGEELGFCAEDCPTQEEGYDE